MIVCAEREFFSSFFKIFKNQLIKAVDKYTDMVKEQLKETKLMTKTFDTLQTEFDAVSGLMRPRLYFHQNPYTINLILFHLLFLAPGSSTTHRAAISNLLVVEVETFFRGLLSFSVRLHHIVI